MRVSPLGLSAWEEEEEIKKWRREKE